MNAFLTGSHAYGTPREDSDVDLVVLVTPEDKKDLASALGQGRGPWKYGKLNLIPEDDPVKFAAWRTGTDILRIMQPVDRDTAVAHFKNLFKNLGYEESQPSGQPD